MLDLAAANGLQLIILSCNPSDYAALGARQVFLREERPPSTVPTADLGAGSDDTADTAIASEPLAAATLHSAPSVSAHQRDELLVRLRELGGKSGNGSLREALGWDEVTYSAVKDALVAAGEITPGRGRGGSIALSGEPHPL
jgi:hypothetical protein